MQLARGTHRGGQALHADLKLGADLLLALLRKSQCQGVHVELDEVWHALATFHVRPACLGGRRRFLDEAAAGRRETVRATVWGGRTTAAPRVQTADSLLDHGAVSAEHGLVDSGRTSCHGNETQWAHVA